MANINCVILNYNDAATTSGLVRTLRNYDYLDQIVVVDNASTDDSYEKLKILEGDMVTVLRAPHNGGYGAGNNLGVRYSVETNGADYVLIANPDISVSDTCIRKMAAVFRKRPDAGVVTATMIDPEFKDKPNAWRLHGFWGELFSMGPLSRRLFRRFLEYPSSFFKRKPMVNVEVVHGSLLMVSGPAFLACGGYDENMFLYQEEAVLGFKMRAKGYRSVLLTDTTYHHEHSASIGKTYQSQAARQRLRHESTMYYLKHYLKINHVQEIITRLWFAGIMTEIFIWQLPQRLKRKTVSDD